MRRTTRTVFSALALLTAFSVGAQARADEGDNDAATPPVLTLNAPKLEYKEVEQRNTGLAIAGASVFGGTYLLNAAIGGYAANQWEFAVPVVGPWIWAGRNLNQNETGDRIATLGLTLDGLAQAAGLGMMIAGLVTKHKVRQPVPQVMVAPSGAGLAAFGTF